MLLICAGMLDEFEERTIRQKEPWLSLKVEACLRDFLFIISFSRVSLVALSNRIDI